jgi:hypothetical protein
VSQKDWKAFTLDLETYTIYNIIQDLSDRDNQVVVLHGHGETTIVKDWYKYAKLIYDSGMLLTICSNLAKDFSDIELYTLSLFSSITVSLDTLNPELFKQLRRGGDITKVLSNMQKIDTLALENNRNIIWVWSIVAVDKTIDGLIDLVNKAIETNVKTLCLCNLTELPTPEGGIDIKHLSKLSIQESQRAYRIIKLAERICQDNQILFDPKAGLIDTLEARFVS